MPGYKGILFDMDGVLVDSEPLFHKAVNVMVERCGAAPITEEENNRLLLGTTVEETWVRVKELRGIPQTPQELLAGYNEVVKDVLRSDLVARPGVRELIAEAQRRGLPIAVASSSLREWVNLKLSVIGLTEAFPVALGGDDIENGKPARTSTSRRRGCSVWRPRSAWRSKTRPSAWRRPARREPIPSAR